MCKCCKSAYNAKRHKKKSKEVMLVKVVNTRNWLVDNRFAMSNG